MGNASGMLSEEEVDALARLASDVAPGGVIVEIGAYRGLSGYTMAMASPLSSVVYSIDLWDMTFPGDSRKKKFANSQHFNEYLRVRGSQGLESRMIPIRGESLEIANAWSREIDLLFIDGGHSTKQAARDFESWSPFVSSAGVIAFHDAEPGSKVRLAIDTILRAGRWEEVEMVHRLAVLRGKD